MNCPNCGAEMENGWAVVDYGNFFTRALGIGWWNAGLWFRKDGGGRVEAAAFRREKPAARCPQCQAVTILP